MRVVIAGGGNVGTYIAGELSHAGHEVLIIEVDPDREVVRALGLAELPAVVHLNTSGAVEDSAEGWDPDAWRRVAENLARILSWTRPNIPAPGDPVAFAGSPALG